MSKFSNRNTRTRSEICSKFTIKTLEQRQWGYLLLFIAICLLLLIGDASRLLSFGTRKLKKLKIFRNNSTFCTPRLNIKVVMRNG